ncbi:MAG: TetR/AcrR family transcriptional regulator [Methylococcaceae bacterium]|nr:TetR/AcrR family transcriptional regulator [Methylococcaceae bacterium]
MKTERNPENTRHRILQAAFQEMHKHGYQGMRIDRILTKTGLKKGALYHHFSSKQVLGYAVLEERIQKRITALWIDPLTSFADPLEGIHTLFTELENDWDDAFFSLGCPLNNLAQEMSPIDDGFRKRIQNFFKFWQKAIADALKKGQRQGIVDSSINTENCALFILASIEGALGMTKNHQDKEVYYICSRELERYLNTLKATYTH